MARTRRNTTGLTTVRGVALLIAIAFVSGPASAQGGLEYSVKANYLVRFAAFVDWPTGAFATARSPVVICVTGRDPFNGTLDAAARGQTAHGRSLAVRRTAPTALTGCHILYVGQDGGAALTTAAGQAGVLTVTDSAAATTGRGVIHFVLSGGRVRFHIDQPAAARNRLTISSRLLNLALSVRSV